MRLLFIGGTGNISADCADYLHRLGHEIFVVTRGRSTVPSGYTVCQADRKDPAQLRAATRSVKPDVVLNFLGYDIPDLEADYAAFRDVAQYVFISSATVYAKPPPRLPITEDFPLGNAWWEYAQKKLACENWLLERHAQTGFPVTIVRPSHTYSRRWIPNPLSSSSYTFARRLEQGLPVFLMDGGQTPWTLTHTTDFSVAFAGLIGNPMAVSQAFHITSEEALSWKEIFGEIAHALGVSHPNIVDIPTEFLCQVEPSLSGPLKGDKSHPAVFDNSKLRTLVPGFSCRKTLKQGLAESVQWLRAHPDELNLKPELDALCDRVTQAWLATRGPQNP
jgi:nucleoside-diphosphate-sugar epimerase